MEELEPIEIERKSGIYKIINLINGKLYVGSAKNLYERKQQHYYNLNNKKHCNIYLQNSWNKHNEKNFLFETIEYIEDETLLIEREQYWMDLYNVIDKNIGYNIQPTAGSNLGNKQTEETKNKIRNAHYGLKPSLETKEKQSKAKKGETICT